MLLRDMPCPKLTLASHLSFLILSASEGRLEATQRNLLPAYLVTRSHRVATALSRSPPDA